MAELYIGDGSNLECRRSFGKPDARFRRCSHLARGDSHERESMVALVDPFPVDLLVHAAISR